MRDYTRFLTVEAATSGTINAALSVAFAVAVFSGHPAIPPAGGGGFAVDFLPQTFMVTLMGVAVPSLIVRKRLRAGGLPQLATAETGPLWRRALLAALVAAIAVGGAAAGLSLASPPLPFATLLALKAAYGGVLGALVTVWALRRLVRPIADE